MTTQAVTPAVDATPPATVVVAQPSPATVTVADQSPTSPEMGLALNALFVLVILSILLERALSVFLDWKRIEPTLSEKNLKVPIAAASAVLLCLFLGFDVLEPLFRVAKGGPVAWGGFSSFIGQVITGLVVAGGSAGAVKLFQDVLGIRKETRDHNREIQLTQQEAAKAKTEAELLAAEAAKAASRNLIGASLLRQSLPITTPHRPPIPKDVQDWVDRFRSKSRPPV